MKQLKKLTLLSVAVSSVMALSACSNGSSVGKNNTQPNKPIKTAPATSDDSSLLTGRLIDSPIQGVHYKTESGKTGITNAKGEFKYQKAGEKIEFSLGNQSIGQTQATSEVHIFDVKAKDFLMNDEQKRVNERLVQIMQLLDKDNNPENGITIDEEHQKRLLLTMNVDFAKDDSLYQILAMKDDKYVQTQLKKFVQDIKSFVGGNKNYITPEKAIAHANKNRLCSSIDDFEYVSDIRLTGGVGKLSSADRSCHQKAELAGFFEHVKTDMWLSRDWYNQHLEVTSEAQLHKDIKTTVENNFVASLVDTTAKHIKSFDEIRQKSSSATLQKMTEKEFKQFSQGLLKDMATSTMEIIGKTLQTVQTTACKGLSDEDCELRKDIFQSKVVPNILYAISNTTGCFSGLNADNLPKCVEIAKNVLETTEGLELTNEQINTLSKKIIEIIMYSVKTGSNISKLFEKDTDKKKVIGLLGEFIDDTIKVATSYNTRSEEETANMSTLLYGVEVAGEFIKTSAVCYGAVVNKDIIAVTEGNFSNFTDCANELTQYLNKRTAEVMNVGLGLWVSNQGRKYYENQLVAEAFLSEYLRLGKNGRDTLYHITGDNQLFFKTHANINDFNALNDTKKSEALRTAMLNIAKKIDVKHGIFFGQSVSKKDFAEIDSHLSQNGRYIASVAKKILSGEYAYRFNTKLGEIVTPQAKSIFYKSENRLAVPMNEPISFSADYVAQKGLVGFNIQVLKDSQKVFETVSDVPLFQHKFVKDGQHTVAITPIIKNGRNHIRQATTLTKTLPIFVIGDSKVSHINYGTGNAIKEIELGKTYMVEVLGNYLPMTTPFTITGCVNQENLSMTLDSHRYRCTLPTTATGDSYQISVMGVTQQIKIAKPKPILPNTSSSKLTATGVTLCADESRNDIVCSSLSSAWLGLMQDGEVQAGQKMSYTLLNRNGDECVKDNVTGLIWEQKTDDGGLRDKDNEYTWYNPDNRTNGGSAGEQNNGKNTHEYIKQLNASNYCGYSDWRLPTIDELTSIVDYGRYNPTINPIFSNTQSSYYWSSSPNATYSNSAWGVNFNNGDDDDNKYKNNSDYVRAVR